MMLDKLKGWGDSHDAFELSEAKERSEDSWTAELKSRAQQGLSIKVNKRKGDPRVIVSTNVDVPPDSSVAATELGEGGWSIGNTVEAVQYGHAPTLSCELVDKSTSVAVQMVIYEDGFTRHTFNEAIMEVGKVHRALVTRFKSVVEARDLKTQAEQEAEDHERRFKELVAKVNQEALEEVSAEVGVRPAREDAAATAQMEAATAQMEAVESQGVAPTDPPWVPTHRVPPGGLRSWPEPDPAVGEGPPLDAGLDVKVVENRDAWAKVTASNGWTGWVDGRLLIGK